MSKNNKNKYEIRFNINEHEYIFIEILNETIDELRPHEELSWFYHAQSHDDLRIVGPYYCYVVDVLDDFINQLSFVLSNNGELDVKVFPNIGYQWNEALYDVKPGSGKWAGEPYLCFSIANGPETFMYALNGVIHIEIIPIYPWLFGRKPKGLKKISFKQFLADYKPLVRTTISRETAEQWIKAAQELLHIIECNSEISKLPDEKN